MKCSFCEQPLVCKACKRPFQPRQGESLLAAYQPDMRVACPECHQLLVCQACSYAYGEEEQDDDKS